MSVSESHNRPNLRMGREASFAQLRDVIGVVRQTPVAINVSLSTAMGCPMEGDIAPAVVLDWMDRFASLGVHGVTLCDTTGMAYPAQVRALCEAARARFPQLELTPHFQDTRGLALAAGIDRFDASLGSLGWCPYAPGAAGNGFPVAGLVLVLGVYRFISEGGAPFNVIGNGVATIVVSKWERALDEPTFKKALQDGPGD